MRVSAGVKLSGQSANEVAAGLRTASDGFLQSDAWKALRREAVALYGCICCKCGADQTRSKRINFDHIKPRKFFPELALDINNLQPLCGKCNKRKGNGPAVDYRHCAPLLPKPAQEAA